MCGIAGVVALGAAADPPTGVVAAMRDRLLHRGPDGSRAYESPGVGLVACRLAIVDLEERGSMPMSSPDGRFHIVHNGEIYNRPELRAELAAQGVQLLTTTDTEVLLQLYARHGLTMLDRLDGMFAFAVWDAQRHELVAARDRCGEKPFFYTTSAGCLYFASEPKALFAAGAAKAFDENTWPELLVFRYVAGTRTPCRGVQRLLPGHWMRAGLGGLEIRRWWSVDRGSYTGNGVWELFRASVRRRLVADVPVGVLLSGGLDSSAVTAVAGMLREKPIPAFTVRYTDDSADEGTFATTVARRTNVHHHEVRIASDDVPRLLADAAWHSDEPMAFVPSPDLLAVSRYARNHVRVLLTGEAADELFGGYRRYQAYRHLGLYRRLGRGLRRLYHLGVDRPHERVHLDHVDWIAGSGASHPATVTAPIASWSPFRAEMATQAVSRYRNPARQALWYEQHTHLQAVLDHCDRQTMGAGIEARVPFLDPRILELASRVDPPFLFRGAHGKQLLRSAMTGLLPKQVLRRQKQGCPARRSVASSARAEWSTAARCTRSATSLSTCLRRSSRRSDMRCARLMHPPP